MDASVLESSTGVMKIDTGHHRIKFQETVRLSWANPVLAFVTPQRLLCRAIKSKCCSKSSVYPGRFVEVK